MIDLSRHIEYLLLGSDKVEVPTLGTFSTKYVPSRWVEEEDIFLPPMMSVSYTSKTEGSGIDFVQSIATRFGISLEDASMACAEFTDNIRQELHDNGSSDIGSIGCFVQDGTDEEMLFIPCEAGVTSPKLYGLDVICTPLIEDDTHNDAGKPLSAKRTKGILSVERNRDFVTVSINRHLVNYLSAIAASIVLFFLITTPSFDTLDKGRLSADSQSITNAPLAELKAKQDFTEGLNAEADAPATITRKEAEDDAPATITKVEADAPATITRKEAKADAPATTARKEAKADAPATITRKEAETDAPATITKTKKPSEAKTETANKAKTAARTEKAGSTKVKPSAAEEYAVVVASAISMKNAENYTKELMSRGYNTCLQTTGKINRVIMPGYKSKEAAYAKIRELKTNGGDEFVNAWVLKLD
ncbi:SPOR domain-containing protein [bacterium]|nr:SPOR domain-containing protein [bacterium]